MGLNYCIIFKKYITFRDKVNALENELEYRKNYVRLLDLYAYIIFAYIKIENQSNEEYLKKADNLISENPIPNAKIMYFYSNVAAALHEIKLYKEALAYYERMVEVTEHNKLWIPALICMAHCQRMLELEVHIPFVEEEKQSSYSKLIQLAYKYFVAKSVKPFAKSNFILKEIAPNLVENVMITIFRDEMNLIANEMNAYKGIYLFDEIIKNNRNDN